MLPISTSATADNTTAAVTEALLLLLLLQLNANLNCLKTAGPIECNGLSLPVERLLEEDTGTLVGI